MSDQRKLRHELRQGLFQFTMQLYESYCETHDQEEAKKVVASAVKEQLEFFMADAYINELKALFNEKIEELIELRKESWEEYHAQEYYFQKISTLKDAMKILEIE